MKASPSATKKEVNLGTKICAMKEEIVTVGDYSFKIYIDPNMRDWSKHPYFIQKFEEFDAFMKKNPDMHKGIEKGSK